MKNISNIKLIGILVILGLVYAGMTLFGDKNRSTSFRSTLVEINPDKVTKLMISKGNDLIEVEKKSGDWKVKLPDGKYANAMENKVSSTLNDLQSIKPSRVASRSKDKWNEFQVDTSGTRVEVYEESEKALDIILGKFGMKSQRQFYSYVRLSEDDETYVSDDFALFSFPREINDFRDKNLLKIERDSVSRFTFTFPQDSSYVLDKLESQWRAEGVNADSANIASFISGISTLSGSEFVDNVKRVELDNATFSLVINENGKDQPIQISAYKNNEYTWIIHSSENPEALFADRAENLVKKIFKGKSELL